MTSLDQVQPVINLGIVSDGSQNEDGEYIYRVLVGTSDAFRAAGPDDRRQMVEACTVGLHQFQQALAQNNFEIPSAPSTVN